MISTIGKLGTPTRKYSKNQQFIQIKHQKIDVYCFNALLFILLSQFKHFGKIKWHINRKTRIYDEENIQNFILYIDQNPFQKSALW